MNILIVDDSIVFRTALSQALEDVPGLVVKDKLSNGKLALDYIKNHPKIDLVIMDIEMPEMDGLEATKKIREINSDVKIFIFSGVSESGAVKTIDALGVGANDFIPKTQGGATIDESVKMIKAELVPRVKSILKKMPVKKKSDQEISSLTTSSSAQTTKNVTVEKILAEVKRKPQLICIGSSTGGPEALMKIFKAFDHKISIPIVIVQHMPPLFTERMASSLNSLSPVEVKEAKRGDTLAPGVCYIAPGDHHLVLKADNTLDVHQGEKVCFVRPSVDVFLESVANNFKGLVLNIVLTGMGCDGANGSAHLSRQGHHVVAQDEQTSVVWGMPGAVYDNGSTQSLLALESFPDLINKLSNRI